MLRLIQTEFSRQGERVRDMRDEVYNRCYRQEVGHHNTIISPGQAHQAGNETHLEGWEPGSWDNG